MDGLVPKPKPQLGPTPIQETTKITVPSPNDPQVKAASRQKAREEEKKKQGRASTDLAGGPVYSRQRLG